LRSGELVFEDLAQKQGLPSPAPYEIVWREFDNQLMQAGAVLGRGAKAPAGGGPYIEAEISAPARPSQKVSVWVRGGQVVGIERTW